MSYITSFEILDEKIKATRSLPTVLEALWDGDTEGWFLMLKLHAKTGNVFWGSEERHHLGVVKVPDDKGSLKADTPWPEAVLAKEWGQKAVEKYGLTFYFPSENEPDDNCPPWSEKHYGFPCKECGKLIRLRYSEYLPHDICYHCNLRRERNETIKKNSVYKDAIFGMYSVANSKEEIPEYALCHYLQGRAGRKGEIIGESGYYIFNNDELVELKDKLYKEITIALANYKPSHLPDEKRRFGLFEQVNFEGKDYELETRFSGDHRDVSALLYRYQSFEKAANEGWTYYLYIIKGIRHRDDAILRFIHFVAKGTIALKALHGQFANVLTEEEVLETLNKLERLECVEIEGDVIRVTAVGRGVLF